MAHLIALVGGNPLPSYLAAAHLSPAQVTLIQSPQTKLPALRLQGVLREVDVYSDVELEEVDSPFSPQAVCRTAKAALKRSAEGQAVHLDYTGGTKVMAVHSRLALDDHVPDSRASYVHLGQLRLDDGGSRPLVIDDDRVTTPRLFQLHGLAPEPGKQDPYSDEDRKTAEKMVEHWTRLARGESPSKAKNGDGHWLERWVGKLAKQHTHADDVRVSTHLVRPPRSAHKSPEVDVLVRHGFRLSVISCAASMENDRVGLKPWEVAVRAQQLTGSLARAAIVAPYPSRWKKRPSNKIPNYGQAQDTFRQHWEDPNTLEFFGLEDMRAWLKNERPESLIRWFEEVLP